MKKEKIKLRKQWKKNNTERKRNKKWNYKTQTSRIQKKITKEIYRPKKKINEEKQYCKKRKN